MATVKLGGLAELNGTYRVQTGKAGGEPVIQAEAGDTVIFDGGEIVEFVVASTRTRKAQEGRMPYVWYTPVAGSVKIVARESYTPDSSEEQLAKEADRIA